MTASRRQALKVLSGAVGGGAALAVGGPLLRACLDPLGKTTVSGTGRFVAVATLDALPEGTPVSFPVVAEAPGDGWNRMPPSQIGSVWLERRGDEVVAFSTICPHLGCGIDYEGARGRYVCPCHDSYFGPDGEVLTGPSPRGMDALEARVVAGRVEVRFETFVLGTREKKPA